MRSRTIKEGSLGLFIFAGVSLLGVVLIWLTGATFSRKTYLINVNFEDANGIREGAIARYRGLEVGRVVSVEPNSNGVRVQIEVKSADLVIPKQSTVEANQAGLVGEPAIEIVPNAILSEAAIAQSPLADDCAAFGEIICDEDILDGIIGVSFEETLRLTQQFSRVYSDQDFVDTITTLAENSSNAAEELAGLTAELTLLSKDVRGEVGNFSENAQSITDAAIASSSQLNQTMGRVNELTTNLNALVVENRQVLVSTLNSISQTSNKMQQAIASLDTTINTVNDSIAVVDTRQLMANLADLTDNAAIASANLKDISVTLNDPENITILKKTLDAARVTFENTQKITSDLDELTGDPTFRKNLIDLVNGLSQLVSSTEQLQDQIQIANQLEPVQAEWSELNVPSRSAAVPTAPEPSRQYQ